MTLTVGSLFSGIGGLDLGLERAGMTVRWQSEIDPYCARVLAEHWPDVPNLGDVKQIDWSTVERVDLICGGYPCQPFSLAGRRAGEDDERHLWPRMLDALRVLRPRWALLENVPGHLSLGFGRVLGDLAESGFDAEWDCIPAAAVGAPHRRDRVFIVAHANSDNLRLEPVGVGQCGGAPIVDDNGSRGALADTNRGGFQRNPQAQVGRLKVHADEQRQPDLDGCRDDMGDAPGERRERRSSFQGTGRHTPIGQQATGHARHGGGPQVADTAGQRRPIFQGRSPLTERTGRRTAGDRGWWDAEPDVGRVAHGIPHRVDRLRALGNSVVPQVAELIGRYIVEVAAS